MGIPTDLTTPILISLFGAIFSVYRHRESEASKKRAITLALHQRWTSEHMGRYRSLHWEWLSSSFDNEGRFKGDVCWTENPKLWQSEIDAFLEDFLRLLDANVCDPKLAVTLLGPDALYWIKKLRHTAYSGKAPPYWGIEKKDEHLNWWKANVFPLENVISSLAKKHKLRPLFSLEHRDQMKRSLRSDSSKNGTEVI